MANDAKRRARDNAKRAQKRFEMEKARLEEATTDRRESFTKAAAAGLSMAEIGDAVGLHRTRVNQIIKGR